MFRLSWAPLRSIMPTLQKQTLYYTCHHHHNAPLYIDNKSEMLLVSAMKASGTTKSIREPGKIHAHMISIGFGDSVFLQNHLCNMYSRCGFMDDARKVFDGIPHPNVFSWNMMITCYSDHGDLTQARQLFDEMPERDSVSWNTMMAAYFRNGQSLETVKLFVSMLRYCSNCCKPDYFSLSCVFKACGGLRFLELGFQLHSLCLKMDFGNDPLVLNTILSMYIKCEAMEGAQLLFNRIVDPDLFAWNSMIFGYSKSSGVGPARQLFDRMPVKDVVSWNTMISILSQHGHGLETLSLFMDMQNQGFMPNSMTYASVVSACSSIFHLEWGKHLHARILRSELGIDVFVGSALVDMYAKCGSLGSAERLFDHLPDRNEVSWTSMIAGFAQSGFEHDAFLLFNQMRRATSVKVDQFTVATVLGACYSDNDIRFGNQVHCYTVKTGYDLLVPVANALMTMYAKCGRVEIAELIFQSMPVRDIISWTTMLTSFAQMGDLVNARKFFDKMPERNIVTWNSMLAAYIQHGNGEEGLKMYIHMLREEPLKQDWITLATVISSCADSATLRLGNQFFSQAIKICLDSHVSVANGIINMYSKCGRIEEAHKIFCLILDKDLVSWNSMIAGYAQNGLGRKAIEIFDLMLETGMKPDHISFIAVLSGCSHSGLVAEGQSYFDSMSQDYSISPNSKHYCCMIDLFGRAGLLEKAEAMIDKMPMEPTADVWGALLHACKIHGNVRLAERAGKHLFDLDPKDSGSYTLLANIYAAAGKSDSVIEVRKLMRARGVKKNPGCSWIEANNMIHAFTADDTSHPQISIIYGMLEKIMKKIKEIGYVEKGSGSLSNHSEKLALAFGLISLPDWAPIHVMKNLRVCSNCHEEIKWMSVLMNRELVVRDANRFHHFRHGSCSCGDYW